MKRSPAGLKARFCEEDKKYNHAAYRTFAESNYRTIYREHEAYKADPRPDSRLQRLSNCLGGLPTVNATFKPGCSDPEHNALYIYTDDCIYRKITLATITDDESMLGKLMPLCRAINKYIVDNPAPKDVVLWHGSKISKSQIAEVDITGVKNQGKFRIPKYMSLTESKTVAEQFAINKHLDAEVPILEFIVKKGCLNCTPIMQHSKYDEQEWLMPPYSPVQWVKQEKRSFAGTNRLVVTFQVLDGMEEPRTIPSSMIMIRGDPSIPSSGVVPPVSGYPELAECAEVGDDFADPASAQPVTYAQISLEGIHPALLALFRGLSPGMQKDLKLLFSPSEEMIAKIFGNQNEETNDLLLDLIEDIYYDLKSRRWSHEDAESIQQKLLEAYRLQSF